MKRKLLAVLSAAVMLAAAFSLSAAAEGYPFWHSLLQKTPKEPTVSIRWAEDVQALPAEHEEYHAESDDPQTLVLLSTDGTVTDFQLLSLCFTGADNNGNLLFDETPVWSIDSLTPGRPLLASLVFYGDIPNNGISYIDPSGRRRTFAVGVSGMDGSAELIEYGPAVSSK